MSNNCVYMYFDEAGNFDFSRQGTAVFCMTCVVLHRPFALHEPLLSAKYDILEAGLDLEYFHATEDRQWVRNRVFEAVGAHLPDINAYSAILTKNRTNPSLRAPEVFYQRAFEWLVKYACPRAVDCSHVVAITDQLPIKKLRGAAAKGLKPHLKAHLPSDVRFDLFHHQAKADLNLQVADYISWAIYRKWNNGDRRSYDLISGCVRSEGDLFRYGDQVYY
ncbi:MAG: hypothetical protein Kow0067_06280 [Coriobacteriia bacterium]